MQAAIHPNTTKIDDALFQAAFEAVKDCGPLPPNHYVEFSNGSFYFVDHAGSRSKAHPLKHLTSDRNPHLPSEPPRLDANVCGVGHPPEYLAGHYKWHVCGSALEAVARGLHASGAVDIDAPGVKTSLRESFNDMAQSFSKLRLYHPHDRKTMVMFEYEEAAARLCRKHRRNLFLNTFNIKPDGDTNINMGWCLAQPTCRLRTYARWSVGEQEDMPCVPIGCLPVINRGIKGTSFVKGIWYYLEPTSPTSLQLHDLWKKQ